MQCIQNYVLGLCLSLWKADIPEHISVMVTFHLSAFLFFIFFSNFNCASSQCHEWITRLRRYKWFILGWIPIAALIQSMKTKYFKPADILSMQFVTYDFVVLFCTGDIFSPSWDRDPSSMTLPEVSSISPPPPPPPPSPPLSLFIFNVPDGWQDERT